MTRSLTGKPLGPHLAPRYWLGGQRLPLLTPQLSSITQSARSTPCLRRVRCIFRLSSHSRYPCSQPLKTRMQSSHAHLNTPYPRPPRRPRPVLVLLNWRLRGIYSSLRTGPRRHIPPVRTPTSACFTAAPSLPQAQQSSEFLIPPIDPGAAFAAPMPSGFDLPELDRLMDLDQLLGLGGFDPATLEGFAVVSLTAASQSRHQQPGWPPPHLLHLPRKVSTRRYH